MTVVALPGANERDRHRKLPLRAIRAQLRPYQVGSHGERDRAAGLKARVRPTKDKDVKRPPGVVAPDAQADRGVRQKRRVEIVRQLPAVAQSTLTAPKTGVASPTKREIPVENVKAIDVDDQVVPVVGAGIRFVLRERRQPDQIDQGHGHLSARNADVKGSQSLKASLRVACSVGVEFIWDKGCGSARASRSARDV